MKGESGSSGSEAPQIALASANAGRYAVFTKEISA